MKFSFRLSLILTFLLISMTSLTAIACVEPGQLVSEQDQVCCSNLINPHMVPIKGICKPKPTCYAAGKLKETSDIPCCPDLVENSVSHYCEDLSPVDSSLLSCPVPPASCASGQGCYPQRVDDLFVQIPESDQEMTYLDSQMDTLQSNLSMPLSNGGYCIRHGDCSSYNCVDHSCAEKMICRPPVAGEDAGSLPCPAPMIKNDLNVCVKQPTTNLFNPNSILSTAAPVPVEGMCKFNFPPGLQQKAEIALRSVRAMEWMLANIAANEHDCLTQRKYLRPIGTKFLEKRKPLLKAFNQMMAKVEKYQIDLLAAKDKVMDVNLLTADDEMMSSHDLASRRVAPYDMLRIMMKRNIAFKNYEGEMNKVTNEASQRLDKLLQEIKSGSYGWGDHDFIRWTIPTENEVTLDPDGNPTIVWGNTDTHKGSKESCRGSWYFGWPINEYLERRKVWLRWKEKSRINTSIFKAKDTNEDLVRIANFGEDLSDPANMSAKKNDFNLSMKIPTGKSMFSLDPLVRPNTYEEIRAKLKLHFAGLKSDPTLSAFNYEPELLPLEAKDCIDRPLGPKCDKFDSFLDRLAHTAFAQSYAYSLHYRGDYQWFFSESSTMRIKLFEHWKIQLDNLTQYYKDMAVYRQVQNSCISNLLGDVTTKFLDTAVGGLLEGDKNYYVEADYEQNSTVQSLIKRSLTLGPKSDFEFEASNLKSLPWNKSMVITPPKDGKYGSGTMVVNANALASRGKTGKTPNSALANIKKVGSSAPTGILGSSSSSAAAVAGGGGGGSSSSIETPEAGKAELAGGDKKKGSDSSNSSQSGNVSGAGAPKGLGFSEAGGASLSSESVNAKDPTGMSEEEKDVMMANYDRTRSKYKTKEEDTLFDIIGKTYVRNLDKILKKKSATAE